MWPKHYVLFTLDFIIIIILDVYACKQKRNIELIAKVVTGRIRKQ